MEESGAALCLDVFAPEADGLGERIEEDEGAQSIVDELDESTIEHFVTEHSVGEQGRLIAVEFGHVLCVELSAECIEQRIGDQGEESVHTFAGSGDDA